MSSVVSNPLSAIAAPLTGGASLIPGVSGVLSGTPDLSQMLGVKDGYQASMAPGTTDQLANSQGTYNTNITNQNALASQLQAQSMGQGPNPAQQMLNQATNQNIQQNAGMIASQKGINPGLVARQAGMNQANMSQQAAGQGATMAAQQQLGAQNALSNLYGQVGNEALNQQNIAQQGFYAPQSINAGTAASNSKTNAGLYGGLMNAGGGVAAALLAHGGMVKPMFADGGTIGAQALDPVSNAAAFFNSQLNAPVQSSQSSPTQKKNSGGTDDSDSTFETSTGGGGGPMGQSISAAGLFSGGKVPGKANVQGDSFSNDTVNAKLSPGEIVIPRHITTGKNPGEMAKKFVEEQLANNNGSKKKFADGGEVVPDYLQPNDAGNTTQVPSPETAVENGIISAQMGSDISNAPSKEDLFNQKVQDYATQNGVDLSNPKFKQGVEEIVLNQFKDQAVDNQWSDQDAQKTAALQAEKAKVLGIPQSSPQSVQPQLQQPETPQAPADPFGSAAYSKAMQNSFGMQEQGLRGEANAQVNLANQQADILAKQNDQMQKDFDVYQGNRQKLQSEVEQTANDLKNQKIDPNHYWANKSTGSKIATAVGLIMGGIGSGLTGQENAAMKFVNSQIDRDIQSQASEMNKKQNLMTYNMHRLNNEQDAYSITKAMHLQTFQNEISKAMAQNQNPIAQARLQQALAPIEAQKAQLVHDTAVRQAMMSGGASGMAPAMQIQMSPVATPELKTQAMKELTESQKTADLKDFAQKQFDTLNGLSGRGMFSPNVRAAAVNAVAGRLQHDFEGRYNADAAQKLADSLFPAKTDFDKGTVQFKQQNLDNEFGVPTPALDALGITPPHKLDKATKLPPAQQRLVAIARQNPTDPRSQMFLQKMGLHQ